MRAMVLALLLAALPCPESYVYCKAHMAAATFDGVEAGMDGKIYYKYSHYQSDYPAGKHVILRSCK